MKVQAPMCGQSGMLNTISAKLVEYLLVLELILVPRSGLAVCEDLQVDLAKERLQHRPTAL